MEGAMSVSAKHSRSHQAVISAAVLMIVISIIAETLPLFAQAQTQTAPTYPYLQQQPTAQGAYPFSYSYYPQPTATQTAPAYPYQLHQQQQPTAQGTTDQLNREELARLQSGNGYSPHYWASGSPPWGSGWGNPWGWDYPWGWGWPVGVSVGFGGCWNCGFRGGFFRPGFGRFGFGHPGFFRPGFGRFGFAHAGFGGGFRGGGRR